ncbi:MAG: SCP2 sterol-binding domain-containing protein [Planctomycetota bacterium]
MGLAIFSKDWADSWKSNLNQSSAYKAAAATWEWPLVVVIQPDPGVGVPEALKVYLDLFRGDCKEARPATPEDIEKVPFVLEGSPSTWKDVLNGKKEVVAGIMTGMLKLSKGNMFSLAGYTTAATELVNAARGIDTEFPPGLA